MTLREARERAGMSQQALADRVGLKTADAIGHYEAGRRTPPGWRIAVIEKALGIAPGSIDWPRPGEASA